MENKYDIFISYRRNGGFETAKHLFDLLTKDGYSVAFDIDTLRNGRFDEKIYDLIKNCSDFVIILNKGVFRRTCNPFVSKQKDWVRLELEYALQLGKNIIPIALSDFSFPWYLPEELKVIKYINGPQYTKEYFDDFYCKLKKFLKPGNKNFLQNGISKPMAEYYIASVNAGAYTMLGYCTKMKPNESPALNNALRVLDIPLSDVCNDYIAEGQVDINLLIQKIKIKYDETAYEFASFGFLFATVAMLDGTSAPEVLTEQRNKFIKSGQLLAIPMGILEYMANAPLTDFKNCLNKIHMYIPNRLLATKRCSVCGTLLSQDYGTCPVCGTSI